MERTKEETVRRLFALIQKRRTEWGEQARLALDSENAENSGPDAEPADDDEHQRVSVELDSFDEEEVDEGAKENQEEEEEKCEAGNDEEPGDNAEEGEEEEAEEDDPELELPDPDASSVHMQTKRDQLSKMLAEIDSLKERLGE